MKIKEKTVMSELKEKFEKLPAHLKDMNIIVSNQLARSAQDLTIYEKRILAFAMGLIEVKHRALTPTEFYDSQNSTFKIPVKDFRKIFGLKTDGAVFGCLKDACNSLIDRKTKIVHRDKKKELVFNWVDWVEFDNETKKITIKFGEIITNHLINLTDNYTKYNVFISHIFKSIHTIRTFEILQTNKKSNEIIIDFDFFKRALGIFTDSYKFPTIVKTKILEKVKAELNEKLDLGFKYQIIKDRKYEGGYKVILTVKKNNDNILDYLREGKYYKESGEEQAEKETPVKLRSTRSRKKFKGDIIEITENQKENVLNLNQIFEKEQYEQKEENTKQETNKTSGFIYEKDSNGDLPF